MLDKLESQIRIVEDFPKPGVRFKDIFPLMRDDFSNLIKALENLLSEEEWRDIDCIGGIEARGFILASGLALSKGKGFVPIRKKGKLPPPVVQKEYALEYGTDILEMQPGKGRILLVDDVLATGGTLEASTFLAKKAGYELVKTLTIINLKSLNNYPQNGIPHLSLFSYE